MSALDKATTGPVCGGQRRRRHRDDLPSVQGRHRHRVARADRSRRRIHRRCSRAVQLRHAFVAACRGRAGRRGDSRSPAVPAGRQAGDSGGPPPCDGPTRAGAGRAGDVGSIIVIAATDAPLLPHQLKRVATRVALGVGRMGGFGSNSSGDIFLAFSTANTNAANERDRARVEMLANARSMASFRPPCRRPKKRSSTRCLPPKRWRAATASAYRRCRTIDCSRR